MKTQSMLISTEPKHKVLGDKSEFLELKNHNELEVVQKTEYLDVQKKKVFGLKRPH